jgi:hypothetical protein
MEPAPLAIPALESGRIPAEPYPRFKCLSEIF